MQKSPSEIRDLLELNSSSLRRESDRICQQAIESQQIRPEDLQFQINAVRSGMADIKVTTTVRYPVQEFIKLLSNELFDGKKVAVEFEYEVADDRQPYSSREVSAVTFTVDGEGFGLSRKADGRVQELPAQFTAEHVMPGSDGVVRVDFSGGLFAVPFEAITMNGMPLASLNNYKGPYRGEWALLGSNNYAVDNEHSRPYRYKSLAEVTADAVKLASSDGYSTCGGVVSNRPFTGPKV